VLRILVDVLLHVLLYEGTIVRVGGFLGLELVWRRLGLLEVVELAMYGWNLLPLGVRGSLTTGVGSAGVPGLAL
jgi:hypothetical protein